MQPWRRRLRKVVQMYNNGPLPAGIDVDIETGLPLDSLEIKKVRAKENIVRLTEAQGLASEVRGTPGKLVLAVVLDTLEGRINETLQQDPVCVHLLAMVRALHYQANIARKQAVEMIRRQLGNETPDWILAAAHE